MSRRGSTFSNNLINKSHEISLYDSTTSLKRDEEYL